MLSRVAESLYWMSRYMERTEDTARLINAITLMAIDMPRGVEFGWENLLKVTGLDHNFFQHYQEANEIAVMQFLIQDEHNPSSIMACIKLARENTRTFREVLPWECWEWVNEMYLYAQKNLRHDMDRRLRYDVLQAVILRRQSIVGLLSGTMSRDSAFQFLRLGRNLERADMTSRILDVSHTVILPSNDPTVEPYINLLWMNILKALSAYQMYRRYVSVHATSSMVIGFVLKDRSFPRSVAHCLNEIRDLLSTLPNSQPVLESVNNMLKRIDAADANDLANRSLHGFIDEIQLALIKIHELTQNRYFRVSELSVKQTGFNQIQSST